VYPIGSGLNAGATFTITRLAWGHPGNLVGLLDFFLEREWADNSGPKDHFKVWTATLDPRVSTANGACGKQSTKARPLSGTQAFKFSATIAGQEHNALLGDTRTHDGNGQTYGLAGEVWAIPKSNGLALPLFKDAVDGDGNVRYSTMTATVIKPAIDGYPTLKCVGADMGECWLGNSACPDQSSGPTISFASGTVTH
jgi:hypothetical protein